MSKGWNYKSNGDHNAICDSCGRKFKASELQLRWDGFYVCKEDFELRHPQDFVKTKNDKITVEWSRPPGSDLFNELTYLDVGSSYCTPVSSSGFADVCEADCARADINTYPGML